MVRASRPIQRRGRAAHPIEPHLRIPETTVIGTAGPYPQPASCAPAPRAMLAATASGWMHVHAGGRPPLAPRLHPGGTVVALASSRQRERMVGMAMRREVESVM